MTDRELMRMALDALEKHVLEYETVEALRARLAQPEQEPPCKTGSQCVGGKCERCAVQPEREWKGLTDEEIFRIESFASSKLSAIYLVEAQLKGKNS